MLVVITPSDLYINCVDMLMVLKYSDPSHALDLVDVQSNNCVVLVMVLCDLMIIVVLHQKNRVQFSLRHLLNRKSSGLYPSYCKVENKQKQRCSLQSKMQMWKIVLWL